MDFFAYRIKWFMDEKEDFSERVFFFMINGVYTQIIEMSTVFGINEKSDLKFWSCKEKLVLFFHRMSGII